jgi:hypothetical protein
MKDSFEEKLDQLLKLHHQVAGLNPALEKSYPIAIVQDNLFWIYDLNQKGDTYQFQKNAPLPMPIPTGIRAAFQVEDYGGRIACVVTPEIFNALDGYVTILHEFVHCYQYETCEQSLKMKLDIARQAQEKGDFMWEIQHPFPFSATNFIEPYNRFLEALANGSQQEVLLQRRELKKYLGLHDFEYMVWQEWKEGFARWVENLVKRQLGLKENKGGIEQPYTRVLFYAGGEAYIEYLTKRKPYLVEDLSDLFHQLYMV